MVIMPRKKPKSFKRIQAANVSYSFHSLLAKMLFQFPTLFCLFVFIYIWSTSSTILSGNGVHVCVSSRKLNNLYCLSAGSTQPNFQIPNLIIPNVSDTSTAITENEAINVDIKSSAFNKVADIVTESSLPASVSVAEKVPDSDIKVSDIVIGSLLPASVSVDEKIPDFNIRSSVLVREQGKNATLDDASIDVENHLKTQRSWISSSNHATCERGGVYVYELPSKFNKDLLSQCNDMNPWVNMCKYFTNNALGEPIQMLGQGWYHTHQYSLEPIFHSRILKHPCRVYNQNEAKLFYVPYYGGLDILRWHFKNVSNDVKDSLALDLIRWLESQNPWYQNLGKDHVFVLGKISWDFRRVKKSSWGTSLLELGEMQNPVKLMIERQPWEVNDVGIPHPTYFHPTSDDDIVAWQMKVMKSDRRSLVSFAGAARPGSPDSIRSVLIEQCISTKDENCKFLDCSKGQCNGAEPIVSLFMESEFCLQPPGDSPTRKSVFDSLISGCIPVVFDPFTAYYQYAWHLPEDGEKYSVYVDKEEVRKRSVNVVERLMRVPASERQEMRRYIVNELMPGLVYGDVDSKFDKFQDAFSVTVNNLLERVNRLNEL